MTEETRNETKKCPKCSEVINIDAKICRYCKKNLQSIWYREIGFAPLLIIFLLVAAFFGFFHIIPDAPDIPVVPKAHFTYSMTIISIEDFLSRWNNRTLGEAVRGDELLENLNRQMLERGWVVRSREKSNIEHVW